MQTTFISDKPVLLLEPNLEMLHTESKEWLNEIAFLQYELRFFDRILKKTLLKISGKKDLKRIDELLDKLNCHSEKVVNEIKDIVGEHERYLVGLLRNEKDTNEQDYREKHNGIFTKLNGLIKQIRSFKTELFLFLEKTL